MAQGTYRKDVMQGVGENESPWVEVEGQIYLGGEIPLKQRQVRVSGVEEVLERMVKYCGLGCIV
jgi:hypothetical protein